MFFVEVHPVTKHTYGIKPTFYPRYVTPVAKFGRFVESQGDHSELIANIWFELLHCVRGLICLKD